MPGAIVIGAGPGIGTSVAERFAREGLPVSVLARSRPTVDAALKTSMRQESDAFFRAVLTEDRSAHELLGASFTCVQAYEYAHAAFSFAGNIYGATFFMATGFHGFHVLVGTIFLIVCLIRAYAGHFSPTQHLGFEFAAWYWHFVDVVWLFLFACIYVWGAGAHTAAGH